ncbi:MAG: hypothetical protein HFJ11_04505 [Bacilli bacterium]|nr:hypothetical protein [Bacilli bacterium]
MGDSNLEVSSVTNDIIRNLFSTLDKPAYWLLGLVYQLFFNVASADLFSNQTVMNFYKRIQLIIGVFMMFQLAVTIIRGIVNPDTFTDSKNGATNLIKRVAISLVLMTLLVPINIPGAKNEWERQLNNHGFLFGGLYSLQHRVLSNNTLGRLILGNDDSAESFTESDFNDDDSSLAKSARIFTSTILKGFYRINLIPYEDRVHKKGRDDATINENRVCKNMDDAILNSYTRLDADPGDIIALVTYDCEYEAAESNAIQNVISLINKKWAGQMRYGFAYMPFISAIVAFVFVFILLNFTVEVAVRAVKLAVLRLIAPIPIISYMDPKGGKDSAFGSWVKTLTTTYLDLFIRLATVYFVLFLIQDMIVNGIYINQGEGILGVLSFILILIGLFVFAKQAPKFIKQVLGIKDEGGKFLSGISDLAAATSIAAGTVGSALNSFRAAKEENDALHEGSVLNGFRNFGSAIAGAIGGGAAGAKAFMGKDASAKAVRTAIEQRNAMRAAHSTATGRLANNAYGLFTGQSLAAKGNNIAKGAEEFLKAQGSWKSALEEEAKANGDAITFATSAGNFNARYEEVERAVAAAHDGKVTINGRDYDANIFTKSFMDDALKLQVKRYQAGDTKHGGKSYSVQITAGQKLYSKRQDVIRTLEDVDLNARDGHGVQYNGGIVFNVDDNATFGPNLGAANAIKSEQDNSMKQRMRRANEQNKK